MHSGGFELTKLTYTRLKDNLIRHRGDQLFIPVPGTSGSPVRQCHKYPGYGHIIFIMYVSSVRPCHNTRSFCEFCNTFVQYPELL